jgi:hypothetical protein
MKYLFISLAFLLGLIFCATYKTKDIIEGFGGSDCPNLLIQKGEKLMLLNKNKARIPGVNPVYFNNLEEYVEFVQYMQANDVKCPILYFQETYNTQGEKGYRMLPDPIEKNAGLPTYRTAPVRPLYDASHDDPPFNKNSYPGMDPEDQNIGAYTRLDKMFHSKERISDNAMDTNWGGEELAEKNIKMGKYDKDFRPAARN